MGNMPNLADLVTAMEDAVSTSIGNDIRTMQGFSKQQLEDIGRLAIDFADMIDEGEFDDDAEGRQAYARILQNLIKNFTRTVEALGVLAVEKAWNAMVDVIWNALDGATGLMLPRP